MSAVSPLGNALRSVARVVLRRRLRSYRRVRPQFDGKVGLEIGGPSDVFSPGGPLPAYALAERVDNCNYSTNTVWEGRIQAGQTFVFHPQRAPGRQYVLEATDLAAIAPSSYDFVLSSHSLEHIANPLRAVREWTRVLRADGSLVLVVPHKDFTFDHRRPVTTFAHLVDDFEAGRGEDDTTHVEEILSLHDLGRDPAAGDANAFRERSLRNVENRCLHHHVFDAELVTRVTEWAGLETMASEFAKPYHIAVIARKCL